jgi:hypothetical protein
VGRNRRRVSLGETRNGGGIMTWDDLTNALNNLTDDVSYLAVDDDGYITLRIGKISNDSPIPEAILEEILGI